MRAILFIVFFLILLVACETTSDLLETGSTVEIYVGDAVHTVQVDVAQTPAEVERGLMGRESLGADSGMWFVFNDARQRTFWMKNTLIPLDIIFVDSNETIVSIVTAQPCTDDPCTIYPSIYATQYVLEVNAGYSAARNISPGDKIKLIVR